MKVTIELHDPEDMVFFAKFLTKLDKRRTKPVTGAPELVQSRISALDKLHEQQRSHDQPAAWIAPVSDLLHGNG